MRLPGDVVIVGGGLAGLAAAVHLGRAGVHSVLFHDSPALGGRARTECRAGFHFNFGPHRLYERGAAVTGLRALEVTIDGAPRGPNGGLAICDGVKHTLPVGCVSLLTTGLLGLCGKREIGRFLADVPTMDVSSLQGVLNRNGYGEGHTGASCADLAAGHHGSGCGVGRGCWSEPGSVALSQPRS